MPPKVKVSREEIIHAAVALVRREGPAALNARALARQLQISTQPIFSNFPTMEDLKYEVLNCAERIYQRFLQEDLEKKEYPPFKISGMSYIRFARQERELFKLLLMRDRTGEAYRPFAAYETVIEMIRQGTGLDRPLAELFHLEMWSCVHGIAVMIATDYMELSDAMASEILTDIYQGLLQRFMGKGECK